MRQAAPHAFDAPVVATVIAVDSPGTPTSWTLPAMPDDDVDAVRALAQAYAQLADELQTAGQQARAALAVLPGAWTGDAATAAAHPTGILLSDVDLACRGLRESADALRGCADQLQNAHDKHAWTWGKVLKLGAVVVVSGTAVVVTAGMATPEVAAADSALLGGEVATAGAAVTEAAAARTGASVALQASSRLLAGVRGMAAFVQPQLPYAVAFAGADAGGQIATTGTLDPRALATSFGLSLALPGAMASTRVGVRALPLLTERPALGVTAGHVAAGGTFATFDAARQQILTGRVDLGRVAGAGLSGATMSAGGQLIEHLPSGWRPGVLPGIVPGQAGVPASGVPRQTLDAAMRDGIDLEAHEGPGLGHTLTKHVGRTDEYLQHRLNTEPGEYKSTFYDRLTAERAISATLRQHKNQVLALERGAVAKLPPLTAAFPEPIGRVLARTGIASDAKTCTVVLRQDGAGGFLLTAFVDR